jgi:hypothetical protein
MKHFSAAAKYTDYMILTGNKVLGRGEGIEREQQQNGSGSAYSYEDFPSNILGVYFEDGLEDDRTTEVEFDELAKELGIEEKTLTINHAGMKRKDRNYFALRMYKFFKELGFVDNPQYFKDYSKIADSEKDTDALRGLKNYQYTPNAETVVDPLDKEIDKKIIERVKEFEKSKG